MEDGKYCVITGTGSHIPRRKVFNTDFLENTFLNKDSTPLEKDNVETSPKFAEVTGTKAWRYADNDVLASVGAGMNINSKYIIR